MYATIGQCALEDNGVEVRDWWNCGISLAAPPPDYNESLNGVATEYEEWLASLRLREGI